MKIVVGLGNIGEKYQKNRHNVGFIALDHLVNQIEKGGTVVSWKEDSKLKAFTTKVKINGKEYLLAKPTTLMNNSGEAVSKILQFFKLTPESLIVVYDDIDLPLGTIRIRDEGSAGTHNGMRSIISELGSQEFKRIRIGIESRGEHAPKQQDISSFVLSDFYNSEYQDLEIAVTKAVEELKSA